MEVNDKGTFEYVLDFEKVEADGDLIIYGTVSDGGIDHDGEMVDQESLRGAFSEFMRNPIIRFQHNKDPKHQGAIGKVIPEYVDSNGTKYTSGFGDDGKPVIVAKISNAGDTESIRTKIRESVLRGFSIGGKAARTKVFDPTLQKEITKVMVKRLSEISVVDLPASKDSFFNILKSSCVGDQCKIKNEEVQTKETEIPNANDTDVLKSVEGEIAKLETENTDLRKQIDVLQSYHIPETEEVVMKNSIADNTIGGNNMEQEENVVRFEPEELKNFIKSTMNEYAEESEIIEKADDYDRLLAETKDLRKKMEALESKVTSQAKTLQNQPQTTMKNESDGEVVKEEEDGNLNKSESLEDRLKAIEESPLYKATQDDDDMTEKDKKKTKKGHLANIVSDAFGTGGK